MSWEAPGGEAPATSAPTPSPSLRSAGTAGTPPPPQDGAAWLLRDLGSANGTHVNGKRWREDVVAVLVEAAALTVLGGTALAALATWLVVGGVSRRPITAAVAEEG